MKSDIQFCGCKNFSLKQASGLIGGSGPPDPPPGPTTAKLWFCPPIALHLCSIYMWMYSNVDPRNHPAIISIFWMCSHLSFFSYILSLQVSCVWVSFPVHSPSVFPINDKEEEETRHNTAFLFICHPWAWHDAYDPWAACFCRQNQVLESHNWHKFITWSGMFLSVKRLLCSLFLPEQPVYCIHFDSFDYESPSDYGSVTLFLSIFTLVSTLTFLSSFSIFLELSQTSAFFGYCFLSTILFHKHFLLTKIYFFSWKNRHIFSQSFWSPLSFITSLNLFLASSWYPWVSLFSNLCRFIFTRIFSLLPITGYGGIYEVWRFSQSQAEVVDNTNTWCSEEQWWQRAPSTNVVSLWILGAAPWYLSWVCYWF